MQLISFACRAFLLLACISTTAVAAPEVGTVTHLAGTLSALRADGSKVLLSARSQVQEGDLLTTVQDTYARIRFIDGAEVVLRPDTQFKIEQLRYQANKPDEDSFVVSLVKGGLRQVTGLLGKRNRERVEVRTATATIGIRGTHFGALLCQEDCAAIPTVTGRPLDNGLHVDVVDGAIQVRSQVGELLVTSGQFAYVRDMRAMPSLVPAGQGVRVTMPPAISQNQSDGRSLNSKNSDNQCVIQ